VIGPVKCADCIHGQPRYPLNCNLVPVDVKRRSLQVAARRWAADDPDGCADFDAVPVLASSLPWRAAAVAVAAVGLAFALVWACVACWGPS
jgi:hypothetical protein